MIQEMDCPTSEGNLLSTVHGRDRRSLRNIAKRDLIAARKYGIRERTFGRNGLPRWKYTYAGIVYICEDDGITEVTSYIIPAVVSTVPESKMDKHNHYKLEIRLNKMPTLCTSHIVFVIDQSASMRTCDVESYKTRSDAVFATIALDYIGKQIDKRTQSNTQYTDVISVIEMRDSSNALISREPCTNVLYNTMVMRMKDTRPRGHGMYQSALNLVEEVLEPDSGNDSCALILFFLSDGKPSDKMRSPFYNASDHIYDLCLKFGRQLTVRTIGFGHSSADFSVLQSMADSAAEAGSHGFFNAVGLQGDALGSAMQSLSTSMSSTRQSSVLNRGGLNQQTSRNIRTESLHNKYNIDNEACEWIMYNQGFNRWEWSSFYDDWDKVGGGFGVAVAKHKIGEGAERVVFRLRELYCAFYYNIYFTKDILVAKECRFEEDLVKQRNFHDTFGRTQCQSAKLADRFNNAVKSYCANVGLPVLAVISFLPCSVLEVTETMLWPPTFRYILVEKRLDPARYEKWNSNNGYVKGHRSLASLLTGRNAITTSNWNPWNPRVSVLERICEDEEEENESDYEYDSYYSRNNKSSSRRVAYDIKLEHFPQAFSHYTFLCTQRKQLVCDLQGVLDTSVSPAVIELTDPAIHCNTSHKSRRSVRQDGSRQKRYGGVFQDARVQ